MLFHVIKFHTPWGGRAGREREAEMEAYRGTSLIRNSALLGPYSRTVPKALWWP